jgi:hypothetical protein
VDDVTGMDEVVERILTTHDTISVVGASVDPASGPEDPRGRLTR